MRRRIAMKKLPRHVKRTFYCEVNNILKEQTRKAYSSTDSIGII